jgi:hypothetical protein
MKKPWYKVLLWKDHVCVEHLMMFKKVDNVH